MAIYSRLKKERKILNQEMAENIFFKRYCQLCKKLLTSVAGQEGVNSPYLISSNIYSKTLYKM